MVATKAKIDEFTVGLKAFKKALSFVGGAIAPNPAVPILEDVLIEIEEQQMTLTGSDLKITLTATIDVDCDPDDIITTCVSHKTLLSLLSSLPEQPIVITVNPRTFGVSIKTDNGKYNLAGENPIDYSRPKSDESKDVSDFSLTCFERTDLTARLNHIIYAVAKPNCSKEHMEGICWSGDSVCATDGLRLAVSVGVPMLEGSARPVIPPKVIQQIIRLSDMVGDNAQGMDIKIKERMISCDVGSYTASGPLFDQVFPGYEPSIKMTYPICWTMNRQELMAAVKRVSLMGNQTSKLMRMESDQIGSIIIRAEDQDLNQEGDERIVADGMGEILTIGFTANLLIESLSNLTGDTVSMHIISPVQGVKFTGDEKGTMMFVMPYRLPG